MMESLLKGRIIPKNGEIKAEVLSECLCLNSVSLVCMYGFWIGQSKEPNGRMKDGRDNILNPAKKMQNNLNPDPAGGEKSRFPPWKTT